MDVRKALRLPCWIVGCVRSRKLELEQSLSEHGVDICLLYEMHEIGLYWFANYVQPDGPPKSGRRHSDL
jgi:hypothetical protein